MSGRAASAAPGRAPRARVGASFVVIASGCIGLVGVSSAVAQNARARGGDDVAYRAELEDAGLVAQDRPWTAALYFATARGLHLTSRDADAIALLDLALTRWPVPLEGTVLAAACARHRARQTTASLQASLPEVDAICARRAPP